MRSCMAVGHLIASKSRLTVSGAITVMLKLTSCKPYLTSITLRRRCRMTTHPRTQSNGKGVGVSPHPTQLERIILDFLTSARQAGMAATTVGRPSPRPLAQQTAEELG